MPVTALLTIAVFCQSAQIHPVVPAKSTKPPTVKAQSGLTSGFAPPVPGPNTVLARVNGVPIKGADVDKLLWDWASRGVLEDLILFQLISQRAKLDHIVITPMEVQKLYDDQIAMIQRQVPAGQDVESFIREKGFPKSRLWMHIEADLMMTKIVDLTFKRSDYISVSTLLVKPKTKTAADLQDAVGKAQSLYNRLAKGEDWDAVLKSADQSPQTVQSHGTLGWRPIDDFPPQTTAQLRILKPHQYSKPIETNNGIQIFRVDDIGVNAAAASLDQLKRQYEARAKQTLVQELQKNAKIDRLYGGAPKVAHLPKLGILDGKTGVGDPVANGDEVTVMYTGKFRDGRVFDSNAKPGGIPFRFKVGSGEVIRGWDLGIIGMRKGGQRKLSIPFSLAYGPRGTGAIPPESDLYFDITLVDVVKPKDSGKPLGAGH